MSKLIVKTRSFIISSKRVLRHTKRPSRRELRITTIMSALGILIIGFIGFVFHWLFTAIVSVIQ